MRNKSFLRSRKKAYKTYEACELTSASASKTTASKGRSKKTLIFSYLGFSIRSCNVTTTHVSVSSGPAGNTLKTVWRYRKETALAVISVIKYECKESLSGSIIWNCHGIQIVCLSDKRCQFFFWVLKGKKHLWLLGWLYTMRSVDRITTRSGCICFTRQCS